MAESPEQDTAASSARPIPTLAEATATLTAPGGLFEMEELTIRGIPTRTWKSAPATLRAVLELSALHGDKDFLVYEDERITFAEHFRAVAALAHALVDRFGITKGDRVAIAMRNLPEWVIAFWASIAVGAVVVPLNAWWTGPELAYGLSDSGASVALRRRGAPAAGCSPTWRPPRPAHHDRVLRGAGHRRRPAGGRRRPPSSGPGRRRCRSIPSPSVIGPPAEDATLPDVAIEPDDDATIFYTSGTTGRPKGAVGTHRNSASNLMNLFFVSTVGGLRRTRAGWPRRAAGPRTPTCLSVPLFHATGCHAVLVTNTAAGGKLVMMHHFDPERALELIERERITIFGGVPAMVMQVIDSPNFAKRDTSSVRSISYGGRTVPARPGPPDQAALPGRGSRQRLRPDRDVGHDHHELRRRLRAQARQRRTAGTGVRRGRGARGVRRARSRRPTRPPTPSAPASCGSRAPTWSGATGTGPRTRR